LVGFDTIIAGHTTTPPPPSPQPGALLLLGSLSLVEVEFLVVVGWWGV